MSTLSGLEEILKKILESLHIAIVALFFGVGIFVAAHHIKEFLADHWIKKFRRAKYRLRTTVVKDMIDEEQTITAKLRRLRAVEDCDELTLDPWPVIVAEDGTERPAKLEHFYSVPGRLEKSQDPERPTDTKFKLIFSESERLKPHRDYSTLLAYVANENADATLLPPYFAAIPPVGKESFTYEVHFPPGRQYVRAKGNPENPESPQVKIYKGPPPPKKGHEIRYEPSVPPNEHRFNWRLTKFFNLFRSRYHVTGGRYDFGDGRGEHDWFRVTIFRPPQDEEISICWSMQGDPVTRPWC